VKYLLDSHVFLWLSYAPEKLPPHILTLCKKSETQLYLSYVTPWEIQIKRQLGKLQLDESISAMIKVQQEDNQLQLLPIQLKHIFELESLKQIHRDPFDRLLIAQAKTEKMTLITADEKIKQYNIDVIW